MPSIKSLITPLAFLLLVSAAPADLRRSKERGLRKRGSCGANVSPSAASVAAAAATSTQMSDPAMSSASLDSATASSSSASADQAVTPTPTSSEEPSSSTLSLPAVNEAFGLSICVGVGMNCDSTTSPTAPSTTSAILPTTTPLAPMTVPPASTSPSTSPPPASSSVSTTPPPSGGNGTKYVFAHFMIGIVSTYQLQDHINDQTLAKQKGIDGFALNIGTDSYSQAQLDLAYQAAQSVGFLCFISFDFNWWSISDTSGVATMLQRYVDNPAQLMVEGKPFVSSFIGDGFDWAGAATQIGKPLYAVPYWQASQANAENAGVAGSFSWDAWPGQLNNVPVDQNMTTDQDQSYLGFLNAAGKTYMAPVSTWFSTHFGKQVSYTKNWVFYSEELWKDRWDQILQLGQQGVNFVEIVTWNDYGESHYIGPYNTPHTDDGSSAWASGLSHTAMLDFAVPYIEAFKAGLSEPIVQQEMMVYWHRPHLKDVECDSTDVCGGKPTGWDFLADSVFVATMTKNGGQVTVTSGDNTAVTTVVDGGVQVFQVPMAAGQQAFSFQTSSQPGTATGSSNLTVLDTCWNGIYNFNYHSGVIPAASSS